MEDKTDKQREFIELRAKGNSFDRIAKKIGVSKGTLISWSKDLDIELTNYKAIETDLLLDEHKISKRHQLELYGSQLVKVRKELDDRDLKDVSTDKLLTMELKLLEAINNNKLPTTFKAEGMKLDDWCYEWTA